MRDRTIITTTACLFGWGALAIGSMLFAGCGGAPAGSTTSQTTSSSTSATQSGSGVEVEASASETTDVSADGTVVSERTETTRTTTPPP